ncbi:Protein clarinet [Dirofilaria immitis]
MLQIAVPLIYAISVFKTLNVIWATENTEKENHISLSECLIEQIQNDDRCYRWIPLIKINKTARETFDTDICGKYGRYSIFIESKNEWEYIKTIIIKVSIEMIEKNMTNSTNLYVLLGGVERFGRMNPRLLYKEHLKDRDRNSSCKRYGVVAQWPELTEIQRRMKAKKSVTQWSDIKEIVSISVQSFSCNELKNYIWNVICKRYCYPYLEESSTTTTKDFIVYRRDYLVNKFRKSAASTSCTVNRKF